MTVKNLLIIAAAVVALLAAGLLWWRYRRRLSPAERERARRLAVNHTGRLTDGELVDSPYSQITSAPPGMLFYRYSASGIEYTAAQDVSNLGDRIHAEKFRPGVITSVKYDPRKPANSIVVCEEWSGLRENQTEQKSANDRQSPPHARTRQP